MSHPSEGNYPRTQNIKKTSNQDGYNNNIFRYTGRLKNWSVNLLGDECCGYNNIVKTKVN